MKSRPCDSPGPPALPAAPQPQPRGSFPSSVYMYLYALWYRTSKVSQECLEVSHTTVSHRASPRASAARRLAASHAAARLHGCSRRGRSVGARSGRSASRCTSTSWRLCCRCSAAELRCALASARRTWRASRSRCAAVGSAAPAALSSSELSSARERHCGGAAGPASPRIVNGLIAARGRTSDDLARRSGAVCVVRPRKRSGQDARWPGGGDPPPSEASEGRMKPK